MEMNARVVDLDEKSVSGVMPLKWAGRPRPVGEWECGAEEQLSRDLEKGYETLAQYAWEILFPYP